MNREKGTAFNENSPRYMCCCNSIHVKTGTVIIAILAITELVLKFVIATGTSGSHITSMARSSGALIIGGAVITCVFYALRAQRAAFLLPYMILLVVGIFWSVGWIIISFFALAGADFPQSILRQFIGEDTISTDIKTISSTLIVISAINITLSLWFLWVVYKCFMFFRDQATFEINSTTDVGYASNINPITCKYQT
uniref:Uncharacterized protein n=1 Tax=Plectus sambesii TaxID=2011161 RepID=A0A914XA98_9BILA